MQTNTRTMLDISGCLTAQNGPDRNLGFRVLSGSSKGDGPSNQIHEPFMLKVTNLESGGDVQNNDDHSGVPRATSRRSRRGHRRSDGGNNIIKGSFHVRTP